MPQKATVKLNPGDIPDLLRIDGKDSRFVYRWLADRPDRLALMKARGYVLCQKSDNPKIKAASLSPDGYWRSGDLVLAKMPIAMHQRYVDQVEMKKARQMGAAEATLDKDVGKLGMTTFGGIEVTKGGLPPVEPTKEE